MAFGHFIVRDPKPGHGRLLRSMMAPQPSMASSIDRFRMCYGAEFIAKKVRAWIGALGAKTAFIEPGSPWENGNCESFDAGFRDELLYVEIFYSFRDAQTLIERWRRHFNTLRPHSSPRNRPPAPEAFVPMDPRPTMHYP